MRRASLTSPRLRCSPPSSRNGGNHEGVAVLALLLSHHPPSALGQLLRSSLYRLESHRWHFASNALVAQRIRASVSGTEGRRFDPCQGHFFMPAYLESASTPRPIFYDATFAGGRLVSFCISPDLKPATCRWASPSAYQRPTTHQEVSGSRSGDMELSQARLYILDHLLWILRRGNKSV